MCATDVCAPTLLKHEARRKSFENSKAADLKTKTMSPIELRGTAELSGKSLCVHLATPFMLYIVNGSIINIEILIEAALAISSPYFSCHKWMDNGEYDTNICLQYKNICWL